MGFHKRQNKSKSVTKIIHLWNKHFQKKKNNEQTNIETKIKGLNINK